MSLSSDFISIRSRVEELISQFSVRDLVEEFTCLGIRPLSAGWSIDLGEIPEGSSSLLPPFIVEPIGGLQPSFSFSDIPMFSISFN